MTTAELFRYKSQAKILGELFNNLKNK